MQVVSFVVKAPPEIVCDVDAPEGLWPRVLVEIQVQPSMRVSMRGRCNVKMGEIGDEFEDDMWGEIQLPEDDDPANEMTFAPWIEYLQRAEAPKHEPGSGEAERRMVLSKKIADAMNEDM